MNIFRLFSKIEVTKSDASEDVAGYHDHIKHQCLCSIYPSQIAIRLEASFASSSLNLFGLAMTLT
jgi:hypothetical protein